MSQSPPIFVTRPALPPLEEVIPYLEQIWQRGILTNAGPLHQQLEQALAEFLGVPFVSLFNNGTNALLAALQSLNLRGEVITTPFTFIATAEAISWNRLEPVFADIDAHSFNLCPEAVASRITTRTAAILPVHCYGTPCDTAALQALGQRHGIPVIYDAAHAFAVRDPGGSVLRHGDLAVLSLHATKVFNTFEGGAVISHSADHKARIDRLRNFGFSSETDVEQIGLNGKMNEFSAAVGLAQLPHISAQIEARRRVHQAYCEQLDTLPDLTLPPVPAMVRRNYSYFPVLLPDRHLRDQVHQALKDRNIFSRRYFFPLLCDTAAYRNADPQAVLPRARQVADRVLCLPIHSSLTDADIRAVIEALQEALAR